MPNKEMPFNFFVRICLHLKILLTCSANSKICILWRNLLKRCTVSLESLWRRLEVWWLNAIMQLLLQEMRSFHLAWKYPYVKLTHTKWIFSIRISVLSFQMVLFASRLYVGFSGQLDRRLEILFQKC